MNRTEAPAKLFDPSRKNMLIVAHQDDEINYTGLIGRLGEAMRFLWVTNGDGLAPFENADPKEYAELRKAETDEVLKTIGRPLEARTCLDYSEIEIYDHFTALEKAKENKADILEFFQRIGDDIYREIKAFMPDCIWTAAYQNGHPEHDLVHILTAYAIRQIEQETGKTIDFYQLPEYEYLIFIPMRFHPLYKGEVHRIELTAEELALKRKALDCYPSQVKLFAFFERVINTLGFFGKFLGKGFTAEQFLSMEYFAVVDKHADYTKSTHLFEPANYINDYHNKVKVRHDRQIAVIAKALKTASFNG